MPEGFETYVTQRCEKCSWTGLVGEIQSLGAAAVMETMCWVWPPVCTTHLPGLLPEPPPPSLGGPGGRSRMRPGNRSEVHLAESSTAFGNPRGGKAFGKRGVKRREVVTRMAELLYRARGSVCAAMCWRDEGVCCVV